MGRSPSTSSRFDGPVDEVFENGGRPGIGGGPRSQIPPRRVREAPIAYRSEGGIKVEFGDAPPPTFLQPKVHWLKYVDAFLLFQDLKTALKGVEIAGKDSG